MARARHKLRTHEDKLMRCSPVLGLREDMSVFVGVAMCRSVLGSKIVQGVINTRRSPSRDGPFVVNAVVGQCAYTRFVGVFVFVLLDSSPGLVRRLSDSAKAELGS